MRLINLAIVALLSFVITGCATSVKPGLTKQTSKIELNNESLLILTAELSNTYKPGYKPETPVLNIETLSTSSKVDRLTVTTDGDTYINNPNNNTYIFRGLFKPGKYVVRGITGMTSSFPFMGNYFVPLHCEIEVPAGQVIDLGKVVATIRERAGNEFRAGPVIPLVDQAVMGFSGGTFEVQMQANQEAELHRLKSIFPALQNATIVAQAMPPFDRNKAQQWWEAH